MDTSRRTIRSILALACFLVSFLATAQNVRYFKDAHGAKETDDERARYTETTTVLEDGIRRVEYRDTRTDRLLRLKHYKGEEPVGKWQLFDEDGKVQEDRDLDAVKYSDCKVTGDSLPDAGAVEAMPHFPGGEAMLYKFLGMNLRYPSEALDAGVQGTVYIMGRIDEKGDWQTIAVCRSAHPFLDHEAWRVLETMPDWTPAKQNGNPVACHYRLPVKFILR